MLIWSFFVSTEMNFHESFEGAFWSFQKLPDSSDTQILKTMQKMKTTASAFRNKHKFGLPEYS